MIGPGFVFKESEIHNDELEAFVARFKFPAVATSDNQSSRGDLKMGEEFLLQFFEYAHLPEKLQKVSQPFGELAKQIVRDLPKNPERTTALRKLLEAKDCAVRALVAKET